MSPRFIVVHLVVAVLIATAAQAQDQQLWRSFAQRLPTGSFVVVQLNNGKTLEGHLVKVTDDAIAVRPKKRLPEPVRVIALADVASIDARREGISPGAKVLIGVGSAMAVVLVLAAFLVPRT
jgi:hypothetical protein